tara:strand:+ start:207 stop:389 length:183 start_codon:yes stop_codon:yes gene_type:complete
MENKTMNLELEKALKVIWGTVDQAREEFWQSEEWAAEHQEIGDAMKLIEQTLAGLYHAED